SFIESVNVLTVPKGAVGVWWIGQGSLVLKLGGKVIWLDPYLDPEEDRPAGKRRLMPPPCAPEEATSADVILLTHDHRDHIDPASLPQVAAASPEARVYAPAPLRYRVGELIGNVERVEPATAGDAIDLGGIDVIPVPAAHEDLDEHPQYGHKFLGYVLKAEGVTVYCAGDTIPYEGLIETLSPLDVDLAFLPINGRDFFRTRSGTIGNMDYREAAETAVMIGADTFVPVHWGMFAGNTVPPGYAATYVAEKGLDVHVHVPALHRPWVYMPAR
ncbi:MAG TPA: MBL fold metallo-hydrolase, partial [Thermomicrobiales bacterium]|nr:MBL fold metallo-hydrolase [Thermomicrobiales bacterium]